MATTSVDLSLKLRLTEEVLADDRGINGAEALYKILYPEAADMADNSSDGKRGKSRENHLTAGAFGLQYNGRTATTTNLNLFYRIAGTLDIEMVPDKTLLECKAAQFFGYMSISQKTILKRRSHHPGNEWLKEIVDAAEKPTLQEEVFEQTEQVIYRSLTHNFADKSAHWLESRVVDQKFMYLNLHSVENWRALLDDDTYLPYPRCCATLKALLETEQSPWAREQGSIDVVVIFGAGTPEKELQIIQNLLKQKRFTEQTPLRVVIVDASVYMLVDTYEQIRQRLMRDGLGKRVDIVQCWADFNHMQPHLRHIRPEAGHGRAAFFLMGGTIGNIDEGKFLASIRDISVPNDLLVISAEFVDKAPDRQKYLAELKKNYSGDHAKELVLEPIRGLLDEKGFVGDIAKRRDMVEPKLFENDPDLSPIHGTVGVMLCLEKSGLDLKLSRSKRYMYHSFIEFFERRAFQLAGAFPCAEFEPYQQVMFVRQAPVAE